MVSSSLYWSLLLPLLTQIVGASETAQSVAVGTTGDVTSAGQANVQNDSAFSSFVMSVSMIIFSEIGDKTFLISALMSMRHPRWLVFTASSTSLVIMTVLSGLLGHTCVSFIPERYTAFLAGLLFLVFGYKLTMEGLEMSKDAGVEEEMAEVEEEIAVRDMNAHMDDVENGKVEEKSEKARNGMTQLEQMGASIKRLASYVFSPVWIQIFAMIFVGELGDRSQISIIAMASDSNYWNVIFGAVVGHVLCNAMAVVGGRYLANKISIRTITLCGALAFFVFALMYVYVAFTI
ncbi:similar to Saccharomyces cerevisiae YBR187W GDT1 Putative protein of unknown function [Maudiozyma barnettii]|uniref:GDT1 family protein n=1 Tax=Maudiozyma barnettii TaxID=61262 RepID=A0A8H2VDS9_9SACH|nr:putative ribosome biosynthesis protein GDT1 [Kazachstania barnettii]CAB4253677.1 similar to Saccharomyces cerevisiae YBR187W GDT1 Putative protein of unknown function [Kazachstania barnettii]CAD1781388.1 similar to Saccharomyces cerevisiae YBR187W GDT1 Putative protein of unknown function [Kazachstania barnettii]